MEGGWIYPAYRHGLRTLREHRFDLIYSTAYPIGSHLVAMQLKRATGLPWIADYRDDWSTRDVLQWPTRVHRQAARKVDGAIIGRADLIVTTSPAHTDLLAEEFAAGRVDRFRTITNGYDAEEFDRIEPLRPAELLDRFVLTHVGSLFRWRTADTVIQAAERLTATGQTPRLVLNLVGHHGILDSAVVHGDAVVRSRGYVTHDEAVAWMKGASALLLINTESRNILGKTFEYLAARRPILAAVREGPTAELVRGAGAGHVVSPTDTDAIAGVIREFYDRWASGAELELPPPYLERYTRRTLTAQLAQEFDWVVQRHKQTANAESPTLAGSSR
jgi:glycosyltransferase involved in cell wall biosynthesis